MPTPRKATHTQLPWKTRTGWNHRFHIESEFEPDLVDTKYEADAALIVHRVNINDEIVRQLEAAVLILENHPGVSVDTSGFKATLARASSEKPNV